MLLVAPSNIFTPMFFSDTTATKQLRQTLIANVKAKRVSHALLFTGREGSGNLALAWAFAQYLFCNEPKEDDSCGICPSCIKISKLSHPDLHWVFPVATSEEIKAKPKSDDYIKEWRNALLQNPFLSFNDWTDELEVGNKQAQISVEESAEILRKLSFKSYEGGYRVVIIWLPEKMNLSAANKLLKILEEPPPGVVFILVSETTDALLPTILSRVQLVKVQTPSVEEIASFLIAIEVEEQKAMEAALVSEGNVNVALSLVSSEDTNPLYPMFIEWMRAAYQPNIPELLTWVDSMAKAGRESQKLFLTFTVQAIRKFLLINFRIDELVALSNSERNLDTKFINFFPSKIHGGNCMKIITLLTDAQYHIERNGNPKIVLMDTSLKISEQLKMPI